MYFDPRPKTKREDLCNRTEELEHFRSVLSYAPLIVVTGLRRSGKTSFANVALAESGCPYAILDLRGLPYNPSNADIIRRLETAFKRIDRKWFSDLAEALRHLGGVSILGNELSFEWGKAGVDLSELFGRIDAWARKKGIRFLMAFDEIQLVRGDKWIVRFFAHVTDNYHNITLVVTGSEVGVLLGFLGFDKPNSPLYGRHFVQIQMGNFPENVAKSFLLEGFKQADLVASPEVIDYAVQRLDGVVGWLTLFGAKCREKNKCSKEIVDEVANEAGKLVREEAAKIAALSRRYGTILNSLAKVGEATWSQIKTFLEAKEARSVTNSAISSALKTLTDVSIIINKDGKYAIADLLLASVIKEDPLPE